MSKQDLLINIQVKNQQALGKLNSKLNNLKQSSFGLGKAAKIAGAAFIALGAVRIAGSIINTIRTFEDLQATLKTIEGSTEKAATAFDLIRKFTAGTTFQLAEVSTAFITLRNAGLNPTQKMMTEIGNIAAGMGKRFDDVAKAVFNATTGEFEMMKQLGIKVKVQGDKLTAIFRGTSTELNNTTEEIMGYLQKVGREDFSGAIEERAKTLSGAFSNFGDALAETAMKLGEGGLKTELTEAARGLTKFINENEELIASIGKFVGVTIGLLIDGLALIFKAFVEVAGAVGAVVDGITSLWEAGKKLLPWQHDAIELGNRNVETLRAMHEAYNVVTDEIDDMSKAIKVAVPLHIKETNLIKSKTKQYDFYEDAIIRGKKATERATRATKEWEDSMSDNVLYQAYKQLNEEFDFMKAKVDLVVSTFENFKTTAGNALADVIMGSQKLGEAIQNIAKAVLHQLISAIIQLGIEIFVIDLLRKKFKQLRGDVASVNSQLKMQLGLQAALAMFTGGASLLGGLFKAEGGPVSAGSPYIVGEKGPEMFIPNSSGSIMPNDMLGSSSMGGGDDINVTFNINTLDASDFDSLLTDRQDLIIGLINRGLAERGKRSLTA